MSLQKSVSFVNFLSSNIIFLFLKTKRERYLTAGKMIDESGDNDLAIGFQPDMRNATVQFQQQVMSARLFDLPCVVEVSYSDNLLRGTMI